MKTTHSNGNKWQHSRGTPTCAPFSQHSAQNFISLGLSFKCVYVCICKGIFFIIFFTTCKLFLNNFWVHAMPRPAHMTPTLGQKGNGADKSFVAAAKAEKMRRYTICTSRVGWKEMDGCLYKCVRVYVCVSVYAGVFCIFAQCKLSAEQESEQKRAHCFCWCWCNCCCCCQLLCRSKVGKTI